MAFKDFATLIKGLDRLTSTRLLANESDTDAGIVNGVTDSDKEYWEHQGSMSTTGTAYAALVDLIHLLSGDDTASDVTIGNTILKIDQTNGRVGVKKAVPTVPLDVVGETIIKGDFSVLDSLDAVVFKVDESVPVVGIGAAPNPANGLLQVAGHVDLPNAKRLRFMSFAGSLDGSLEYTAKDNIVLANAEAGGPGLRDRAGFQLLLDSLGTAPALIIDDQGQVGFGTPAPTGADSNIGARMRIVGGDGRVVIEDTTPEFNLKAGVGDDWGIRMKLSDLYFTYAGNDAMKITIGGLYGVTQSASRLWGINSDATVYTALTFGGDFEAKAWKTQVAPNATGSLKFKAKLDGVAGSYPNSTYGILFLEGYGGNMGLWVNSLPAEAFQMGDASLTEQMGIKVFDGGANKMAFIDLMEQNNDLFLYQDTSGILRTHTAKPGATGDTTGATRVISQSLAAHIAPNLAAGAKPSDVVGALVVQYASGPATTRLYARSADGNWRYVALT